jgi:hypothetical protein
VAKIRRLYGRERAPGRERNASWRDNNTRSREVFAGGFSRRRRLPWSKPATAFVLPGGTSITGHSARLTTPLATLPMTQS